VLPNPAPQREGWLRQVIADLNPLQILLLLYASIVAGGLFLVCAGVVALAMTDAGFAQFVLVTFIVGMLIGLPHAFKR
jgi:hypothetical protein